MNRLREGDWLAGVIGAGFLALGLMYGCAAHGAEIGVTWKYPATNLDNTPLTNLAGANVYWGTASSNYTHILDVPGGVPGGPGAATVTVPDPAITWPAGYTVITGKLECVVRTTAEPTWTGRTYYLNGTAYNTAGLESDFCNEVAKVSPASVTNGYYWGTTPATATTWVPVVPAGGGAAELRMARAAYPKTLVYVRRGLKWKGGGAQMLNVVGVDLRKPGKITGFTVK